MTLFLAFFFLFSLQTLEDGDNFYAIFESSDENPTFSSYRLNNPERIVFEAAGTFNDTDLNGLPEMVKSVEKNISGGMTRFIFFVESGTQYTFFNRKGTIIMGFSRTLFLDDENFDTIIAKFAEKREAERLAQARKIEEERLAEENRRLEEEKRFAELKKAEEEKRLAEEKRIAEEKRLAELQKAEEEERRLAEEKRIAEEKRLAELQKAEEEKRLAERKKAVRSEDGEIRQLKVVKVEQEPTLSEKMPELPVTKLEKKGKLKNIFFRKFPEFSRVTMELDGEVDYQFREISGGFVIDIHNFDKIPQYLLNIIDTRAFKAEVAYIYPKKVDGVLKIYIKTDPGMAVRKSKDKKYVNFDFFKPTIE